MTIAILHDNKYIPMSDTRSSRMILATVVLAAGSYFSIWAENNNHTQAEMLPEQLEIERTIDNTHVIMPGVPDASTKVDSIRALITKFYVDQFRHSQDPKSPYFMFMSKNANMAMGIGGMVRMRGWYDWNGSIPANGFSPFAIQIPKDPANMRHLDATPAGTSLFFSLIGENSRLGSYMAYIECNFDGYNHVGFKLKKAYLTVEDWTAGYAPSTFSDPAAEPLTIDGAGANGKISKTNILVRYMHDFRSGWSIAGSVEFPKSQIGADAVDAEKCSDYVPDVAVFGQYQWDGGFSHVRLSGLMRVMSYRNMLTGKNHNIAGWGVKISSVFKVFDPLSFNAIVAYGQGHASYVGDLSGGNYDLVGTPGCPGKLYAPEALSLTAGAKFYFMPNLYSAAAVAMLRYYPKRGIDGSSYKYGMYGAVNLFWDITPRFQVGMEYLAGKRKNIDGSHANANRINAMFMLSF